MLLELQTPFPVQTPLGHGYAILVESEFHDQWWTVALDSGALVTFKQEKILICRSYSHGRGITDEEMRQIISRVRTADLGQHRSLQPAFQPDGRRSQRKRGNARAG